MEKSEIRPLIKHYFLRGKTITETKAKLNKYYGDSAPSISMVKKCFTEFRCGRTSTIDAERSGPPVEVAIPETIETSKKYYRLGRYFNTLLIYLLFLYGRYRTL